MTMPTTLDNYYVIYDKKAFKYVLLYGIGGDKTLVHVDDAEKATQYVSASQAIQHIMNSSTLLTVEYLDIVNVKVERCISSHSISTKCYIQNKVSKAIIASRKTTCSVFYFESEDFNLVHKFDSFQVAYSFLTNFYLERNEDTSNYDIIIP